MCTPTSLKLEGILRLWSKSRLVELRCSVQQHPSLTLQQREAKKRREVEWKVSKKPSRFSYLNSTVRAFLWRDLLGGFLSLAAAAQENTFCASISSKWFSGWVLIIGSRFPGKHILHKQWELIILGVQSVISMNYRGYLPCSNCLFIIIIVLQWANLIGLSPQKESESMETPQNWMFYLEILLFSPKWAHLYR